MYAKYPFEPVQLGWTYINDDEYPLSLVMDNGIITEDVVTQNGSYDSLTDPTPEDRIDDTPKPLLGDGSKVKVNVSNLNSLGERVMQALNRSELTMFREAWFDASRLFTETSRALMSYEYSSTCRVNMVLDYCGNLLGRFQNLVLCGNDNVFSALWLTHLRIVTNLLQQVSKTGHRAHDTDGHSKSQHNLPSQARLEIGTD